MGTGASIRNAVRSQSKATERVGPSSLPGRCNLRKPSDTKMMLVPLASLFLTAPLFQHSESFYFSHSAVAPASRNAHDLLTTQDADVSPLV
jgi:hypothetical protein